MARIHPEGWRELAATGAAAREIETLARLEQELPDDYAVYHGVHWTRVQPQGYAIYGEIDFAVMGPSGKLLFIEQKSGFLDETRDGLAKRYGQGEKNVPLQMARTHDALRERLRRFLKEAPFHTDALLYCPDYQVKQRGSAGIPAERIVDASSKENLARIIRSILPADDSPLPTKPQIERFLTDTLKLVPDVNALAGQARTMYTRLSGGLSQWARTLDFVPFRLRVIGTAGSGKTQLALAVYTDAVAAGRRPLYVCYNRPLADHIGRVTPKGGEVATYHQLCERVGRDLGRRFDYSRPGVFAEMEAVLEGWAPPEAWQFDELIVDEGQDFHASWMRNALRMLRPGGRAWWLEDPMQNLYDRPRIDLPGWVVMRSDVNYRSPQDILASLNRLVPLPRPMESGSPLAGSEIEIVTYADARALVEKTRTAITECIKLGFKRQTIAVVTYRGREHSALAPYTELGPHRLKAPTGQYDLLGNALYSDGEVVIDSVLRFKGQAAPCVIFTEIDFEALDEAAARRLFVGATRATMKLVLVVSERSAKVLMERLGD